MIRGNPHDDDFFLSYVLLVMLEGELTTEGGVTLRVGQSALLPAAAMPLKCRTTSRTEFAVVIPRGAHLALDL